MGIERLLSFSSELCKEKVKSLINKTGVLPFPSPVKGVALSKFVNGIFNLIASPAERIVFGAPVSITDSILPKDLGCLENKGRIILIEPSIFLISKLNLILIKNNFVFGWDILDKNLRRINAFLFNFFYQHLKIISNSNNLSIFNSYKFFRISLAKLLNFFRDKIGVRF